MRSPRSSAQEGRGAVLWTTCLRDVALEHLIEQWFSKHKFRVDMSGRERTGFDTVLVAKIVADSLETQLSA